MSGEEDYGACIYAHHKERLLRSYESEKEYYLDRLERVDDDTDPRVVEEYERRIQVAEENLVELEKIPVCDSLVDDTDVPAQIDDGTSTLESPDGSEPEQPSHTQ
jgi:hypothetical protein